MAVTLSLWLWSFFIAMFIVLITSADANAGANGGGAAFSYVGSTGPDHWGSLDKSYAACSNDKQQSPIDIQTCTVSANPDLKTLEINYTDSNAKLVNTGIVMEVRFGEDQSGGMNLNGKYYPLKQMHWHIPSEHLVDGKQSAAELHLVHIAQDGSISVVSVRYNLGHPDFTIQKIEEQLHILSRKEANEVELGIWNIENLNTNKYYRYNGSLTTPPCSGNVIWNIIDEERSMSREQVELLMSPLEVDFKVNSRPTQPLNGRKVELYQQGMIHRDKQEHEL